MKTIYNWIFTAVFTLVATAAFSQGTVTGTVIDGEFNEPLPGANVMVKGTSNGASTDFNGQFSIDVSGNSGTLVITYVGFVKKEVNFTLSNGTASVGNIILSADAQELEGVVVTGVADIAKDRETPVAVSTIKASEIQEKLGSQEFPEILKSTPSVYVTKQGGGFGDARINIRGFDQRNTAVMINGVPVNDMENGWVYWSNWAGLSDVTSAMQVQRGLGSSKLAISSVGGTINVLTRSAERSEGGSVMAGVGNNNYLKLLTSYNTGLMDNGLSASILFSRTAGDGYAQGTSFEGYNYYFALGYKPNNKHDFQFTVTGAPQQHNQRGFAPSISDYIRYGQNGDPNIKYNSDFGYRNGEEFTFSGNFYHKPVTSLNWDWNISDSSTLSSVLYASFGRGGSIGSIGRINGGRSYYGQFKDSQGHVRVDDIIAWNRGVDVPAFGDPRQGYTGGGDPMYQGMFVNGGDYDSRYVDDGGHIYGGQNGISQRSSVNSHNWFGAIINFNNEINENWTFDLGADLRTYKGIHYRRLVDHLGSDVYVDNDNINENYRFINETYAPTIGNVWNVFKDTDKEVKIDYFNDGKVNWAGAFGQLEYKNEALSAFVQAAISNQGFKRIDYFNYLDSDPEQESDWENFLGGNVKGGLNYNINEQHNVFANAGYYSKQPLFDGVFIDYNSNTVNEDAVNEKVFGLELGYGFRSSRFRANVNLYRTSWKDRFLSEGVTVSGDQDGSANFQGLEQIHSGVEVDFTYMPHSIFNVYGMVSVGNWEYGGDVEANVFDSGQNLVGTYTLYLDGVKVGDAAQFTTRLGVDVEPLEGLKLDASWYHADNLYADFAGDSGDFVEQFGNPDNQGALQLPAYDLIDAGLSYKMLVGRDKSKSVSLRLNVNNVFDETYISESETNVFAEPGDETYNGISTSNRVYFGFGRTWNFSLRYNF
ncbi:TonB-dependent receptor [Zhouia amylolytica]|uniref:Outer membrane receptor for ferrienterochelin and colicin n=1 Tax=Zhouia amylolytica AD3 TaxID=1286632 RepID=W2UM97_9FLAO|nr:carboxypeptidase-like regulatory domain-containing protein [Zhouia amylolytica]ETN94462.1 outer membrane receptor for ferrienterochelin and colicin [Zhouia amylolytica AD3]MCQ0110316.1 TonB-dependent receptor [Zhouia amylolytica]